jgi:hypothetical protein
MKKMLMMLCLGVVFVFVATLAACSVESDVLYSEPLTPEIKFSYRHGQELIFNDATELVELADHVFIGEVERISFAVMNEETGKAPTEECHPIFLTLITIYDVNVLTSYKGVQQSTMRIATGGGIKGYRESEQLAIIMEAGAVSNDGEYRILINLDIAPLEVGRAYLFTVQDLIVELDGYSNFVGVISSLHSFLDLSNPFETMVYFSNITVESLISEFGEAAFEEFLQNRQLKRDNYSTLTPSFENIEPYTVGSNQEWALWALSQLDNSDEKIRLYNFLLRAHTYLLIYDRRDFIEEYYSVKNLWLGFLEEIPSESVELMLDDENWVIDVWFPIDEPFRLTNEEFLLANLYFMDANPQFFLNRSVPAYMSCDLGLSPAITISAYWAFANRRQETYRNIQYMFDNFKKQMTDSIDISNQFYVVRYVHGHVIDALSYNFAISYYVPRIRLDMDNTILGYFSEIRETVCKGYATIIMYLLNRLGIPTIDQGGAMIVRDDNGDIYDLIQHAWNIVMLYDNWYFLDATWEISGEYNWVWFLQGRGENNNSHFLRYHSIAEDMIYPEVSITAFNL